jgi:hypothetical protein
MSRPRPKKGRPRQAGRGAPAENFEPPIVAPVALPDAIIAAREQADADSKELAAIITPRIQGHLVTYRMVLDALIEAHQRIADTMDFDIGGRTRWTAVWETSGRCLGLCNCLIAQLQGGFASETVPTLRAIHEADQLLAVLIGPGEEQLLRQWLDDTNYVKVVTARAAAARIEKPYIAELKKRGIELEGDQSALSTEIYDVLSKPAHNMRVGFAESVSSELRRFSYGSHPDPRQRAVHVEYAGQLVEEVTLLVGRAFATRFLGRGFYEETIKPLLVAINAVRDEMPIDPVTVHSIAIPAR